MRDESSELTRRDLLGAAGAAAALVATGASGAGALIRPGGRVEALPALPDPKTSGLDHIVVLCMENRSFDHYLGWVPGANGRQAQLSYPDSTGKKVRTFHLETTTGCGWHDPAHGYKTGRSQLNGGRCDGFLKDAPDRFGIGYYTAADLEFYRAVVPQATVYDRYFCSVLTSTFPNRLYTHSAATDRLSNTTTQCFLPTIWDRLAAAGVPANYYFSDLPVLALYGQKYVSISRPLETFFTDAASGRLPAYSYLDPNFGGAEQGTSNDDHPHADIRRGQSLMARIARALVESPQWSKSALFITYDEWGGFFDHVAPPRLPDDVVDPTGKADHSQAGFRVPTIAFSPFARPGHVAHQTYDHSSILKAVEWRFGLAPLTKRDSAARNLVESFDFKRPSTRLPVLPPVTDPGPYLCEGEGGGGMLGEEEQFWAELAQSPRMRGWDAVRS